jgi:hypothetical protein
MKSIKPKVGGVPERRSDEEADKLVKSGVWVYCKKTDWKKEVRDKAKLEAAAKARQAEKKTEKKEQGKDGREINKHKDRPRR